jgi:hypothetical protein
MSMPLVVREYIRNFRQHERVKLLQLVAGLRRAGRIEKPGELARAAGEKIQKWQDEDQIRNFVADPGAHTRPTAA